MILNPLATDESRTALKIGTGMVLGDDSQCAGCPVMTLQFVFGQRQLCTGCEDLRHLWPAVGSCRLFSQRCNSPEEPVTLHAGPVPLDHCSKGSLLLAPTAPWHALLCLVDPLHAS